MECRRTSYYCKKRKKSDIITGANVTKVNLESNKAVSIDILYQNSFEKIYAANEIILSRGAINTPKLLMLSGIGPADELKENGIKNEVNFNWSRKKLTRSSNCNIEI